MIAMAGSPRGVAMRETVTSLPAEQWNLATGPKRLGLNPSFSDSQVSATCPVRCSALFGDFDSLSGRITA
jgi:hypothetical protein